MLQTGNLALDYVQEYWLKSIQSMHENLRENLHYCVDNGSVPEWITFDRSIPVPKTKTKGWLKSNSRPIILLRLVCKLMTGIIAEEIYVPLEVQSLIPEE